MFLDVITNLINLMSSLNNYLVYIEKKSQNPCLAILLKYPLTKTIGGWFCVGSTIIKLGCSTWMFHYLGKPCRKRHYVKQYIHTPNTRHPKRNMYGRNC